MSSSLCKKSLHSAKALLCGTLDEIMHELKMKRVAYQPLSSPQQPTLGQLKRKGKHDNVFLFAMCTGNGIPAMARTSSSVESRYCVVQLEDKDASLLMILKGELVDAFRQQFVVGRVYRIENFLVKALEKRFGRAGEKFQLELKATSIVHDVTTDNPMTFRPCVSRPFCKISDLPSKEFGSPVDLLAVVKRVGLCNEHVIHGERPTYTRAITLTDFSEKDVTLFLWNDAALCSGQLGGSTVLIMSGTFVNYDGPSVLVSLRGSINANPDVPLSHELRERWGRTARLQQQGACDLETSYPFMLTITEAWTARQMLLSATFQFSLVAQLVSHFLPEENWSLEREMCYLAPENRAGPLKTPLLLRFTQVGQQPLWGFFRLGASASVFGGELLSREDIVGVLQRVTGYAFDVRFGSLKKITLKKVKGNFLYGEIHSMSTVSPTTTLAPPLSNAPPSGAGI